MRLLVDKKDRLWLITVNNVLGYFDVNKLTFHEVKVRFRNKIISDAFGDFTLDANNEILLVIRRNKLNEAYGVATYNEKEDIFTMDDKRFALPDGWYPTFLSIDSVQRCYWFGTNNGLVKYSPHTGNFNYRDHNPDKDPIIRALQNFKEVAVPLLDNKGNFWMTTFQDHQSVKLIQYEGSTKKVTDRSKELAAVLPWYYEIHNISIGSEGDTWLNGLNMLVHVNAKNKFEAVPLNASDQYSIHFDDSYTFQKDRENNIWISTDKGLYWFNTAATLFHTIPLKRQHSDEVFKAEVTDINQLKNGNILVATWGSGLFEFDSNLEPVNSAIVQQGLQQGEGMVWSVVQRANGDIWRANQDGYLFIYHQSTKTTSRIQPAIFNKKTIRQIVQDKQGNLWLGTHGGALVKWIADTGDFVLVKKYSEPVRRLYSDNKSHIWVIADDIEEIDPKNNSLVAHFIGHNPDGVHLPSADLRDIIQFNDSLYAIAGELVSILNANTGHFSYLSSSTGLPSDYVSNLAMAQNGNLWMGTENGIYSSDLSKNLSFTFSAEDGVTSTHFSHGAACLLRDGRILFGTIQDFISVDPAGIGSISLTPPRVEITAVKLLNKSLSVDSLFQLKKIELGYQENALTFAFATLTYQMKYAIAYNMKGLNDQWTTIPSSGQAVFSYLPPGDYVFRVGSPDAQNKVRNIVSLNIHIKAPFWRTPEFFAILVLLTATAIWWMYKFRKKRWQEMLHMRSTIGRDLHKEVSTTLKNISVLSEIAAMKADSHQEQSKDYIREIKQKSRRTVIAMDDVMWSIDPANDSMSKVIDRIYEIADILTNEYGTHIDIEIDKSIQHYKLSMKERLELMMIYKRTMLLLSRDAQAGDVSFVMEKEKNVLAMKFFAADVELPESDQKVAQSIREIIDRAASINSVAETLTDKTGTIIFVFIKHTK